MFVHRGHSLGLPSTPRDHRYTGERAGSVRDHVPDESGEQGRPCDLQVIELSNVKELNSVASVNSNNRTTVGLPNNSS